MMINDGELQNAYLIFFSRYSYICGYLYINNANNYFNHELQHLMLSELHDSLQDDTNDSFSYCLVNNHNLTCDAF